MLNHVVNKGRQVKTCRVCRLGEFPGRERAFGNLWSNSLTLQTGAWDHGHSYWVKSYTQTWVKAVRSVIYRYIRRGRYIEMQTHRERKNMQSSAACHCGHVFASAKKTHALPKWSLYHTSSQAFQLRAEISGGRCEFSDADTMMKGRIHL